MSTANTALKGYIMMVVGVLLTWLLAMFIIYVGVFGFAFGNLGIVVGPTGDLSTGVWLLISGVIGLIVSFAILSFLMNMQKFKVIGGEWKP